MNLSKILVTFVAMLPIIIVGCGDDEITQPVANQKPVAANLSFVTLEDTPVTIELSATDADNDSLTYSVITQPGHGAVTGTLPSLIYTPIANFNGKDTMQYWASDGLDTSAAATVDVTVNGVNDPPTADAGVDQTTAVNFTVTLDGRTSSDPEGQSVSFLWTQTSGPTVSLSDSTAAQPEFNGPALSGTVTFSLVVSDDSLSQSTSDEVNVTFLIWNKISAGPEYSIAIRSDGTLWGWGLNRNVLGQEYSSMNRALFPIQIGTESDWSDVSPGKSFVVGLKTNGTLWAWGDNGSGQLGQGNTSISPSATPLQIGLDNNWVSASSGKSFAVARKSDGTLWSWGENSRGQLGLGDSTQRTSPVKIGIDTNWVKAAAGRTHTVALRSDSSLWAWGENNLTQLGDGTQVDRPAPVEIEAGTKWLTVSAGGNNSGGIRADGTCWAWGTSTNGLLMIQKGSATDWAKLSVSSQHSMLLNSVGEAWSWGVNNDGELGDGTLASSLDPVAVASANSWLDVEAGGLAFFGNVHSLGLASDGSLWAWGSNADGKLGIGVADLDPHSLPVLVGQR